MKNLKDIIKSRTPGGYPIVGTIDLPDPDGSRFASAILNMSEHEAVLFPSDDHHVRGIVIEEGPREYPPFAGAFVRLDRDDEFYDVIAFLPRSKWEECLSSLVDPFPDFDIYKAQILSKIG